MATLLFIDSGLGGLPYTWGLETHRRIYVADRAYFPYGGRSVEFLQGRLKTLCENSIERYSPDIIVLACNTASVSALAYLRKVFPLPFVGTVPAVKTAVGQPGNIGIIATERTIQGEYLQNLIHQFAPERLVEVLAAPDLVDFVEEELYQEKEEVIRRVLQPYIDHAKKNNWRAMVLGCTHFIHLKPWLRAWLPPQVALVDSTEGVLKRVQTLLVEKPREKGESLFYTTGGDYDPRAYKKIARQWGFELQELAG